jgi:hypothetical protein
VRHFRNSLFALAAFLWLPASAHCQLEAIPGLEFLRCAAVTATDGHSAPDDCSHCCAMEKSAYRASVNWLTPPAPALTAIPVVTPQIALAQLPDEVALGVLVAAPPEFVPTRHFLFRTALPVRAPSFPS